MSIDCPEITNYLDMIENDQEYPVCREQKMFSKFIKKIFETENLTINRAQLEKYLALQKYFPYQLFPWEVCVFSLHNCVYRADGLLRFPEAFLYMGRGGGKNGYLSFEDFCLLTPVNGVRDYHIDIFANSEDQAKTSFTDVYNVLERNERKLQKFFKWNLEVITSKQTGSQLRFRTSNAKTKDGGRPGKVDFDEYHAYESYDVIRVAKTGLGKKEMPRSTIITTDGDVRDGPLDHTLARCKQILEGAIPDNGLLPFICKLDKKEEVHKEKNWYKANPSLRYFPNMLDEMRREYADYKLDNIGNAAFMTKRMNIPQGSMETEVTAWENIMACSREPTKEPTVWAAGLDFARTTDFVAAILFGLNGEEWVWRQHTWVCSQCKDLSRIKFPVQDAVERGLITWVEDVEIPPELPAAWLGEQMAEKRVIGVAIDDYRFSIMKKALEGVGFTAGKDGNIMQVKGRNIMQIAPALIAKLNRQQVAFGNDPLMRWYINNTKQLLDTRGNITFGKIEPKTRKTDGFMAAVAAVTQLDKLEQETANDGLNFGIFTF